MSIGSGKGKGIDGENARWPQFETFLDGWLVRQEHYLDELLTVQQTCHLSKKDDLKDLIVRVLAHYKEYYEEKSRADVFSVFSPVWLTPLEKAFLWIGGFKPGLAFHLVDTSVDDLTEDQAHRMRQLKEETTGDERVVRDVWARIQESVAAPPLLDIVRRRAGGGPPPLDGVSIQDLETVIGTLRSEMECVLANADTLRMKTAERVLDVLGPAQNVKFLAAATQLQLQIRTLGLQRQSRPKDSLRL